MTTESRSLPWLDQLNRQRTITAGNRDKRLARAIMGTGDVWGRLSDKQREVVRLRHDNPELSWEALAQATGKTKNQLWSIWNRLYWRPDIAAIENELRRARPAP